MARNRTRLRVLAGVPVMVDSAPAVARIVGLRAQGMGYRALSQVSGLSSSTVRRLSGPNPPALVTGEVAAKAVAARLETYLVDAWPTIVRLRACTALGWSRSELMALYLPAATSAGPLDVERRKQVTAATAAAVLRMVVGIGDRPGGSRYAQRYAAKRGWLRPIDFDEDDFYNPAWSGPTKAKTTAKGKRRAA